MAAMSAVPLKTIAWVLYRVIVSASTKSTADRFVEWMRIEHGPDLLAERGCFDCRVYRLNPLQISCDYLFESQAALDSYLLERAPVLREKARAAFAGGRVAFSREVHRVEAAGSKGDSQ